MSTHIEVRDRPRRRHPVRRIVIGAILLAALAELDVFF
jgi:hypothetical protein